MIRLGPEPPIGAIPTRTAGQPSQLVDLILLLDLPQARLLRMRLLGWIGIHRLKRPNNKHWRSAPMRIHFRTLSRAHTCIQTMQRLLLDSINVVDRKSFHAHRVQNAFSRAFGYTSLNDLKLVTCQNLPEAEKNPNREEIEAAFERGFTLWLRRNCPKWHRPSGKSPRPLQATRRSCALCCCG